mmetsp:Transcript_26132/g.48720  ORF Transcript_26132/g.48720 Transcript_26132/m.48720 type:complete len:237 (-) Transcript_26132:210-920(-)
MCTFFGWPLCNEHLIEYSRAGALLQLSDDDDAHVTYRRHLRKVPSGLAIVVFSVGVLAGHGLALYRLVLLLVLPLLLLLLRCTNLVILVSGCCLMVVGVIACPRIRPDARCMMIIFSVRWRRSSRVHWARPRRRCRRCDIPSNGVVLFLLVLYLRPLFLGHHLHLNRYGLVAAVVSVLMGVVVMMMLRGGGVLKLSGGGDRELGALILFRAFTDLCLREVRSEIRETHTLSILPSA